MGRKYKKEENKNKQPLPNSVISREIDLHHTQKHAFVQTHTHLSAEKIDKRKK